MPFGTRRSQAALQIRWRPRPCAPLDAPPPRPACLLWVQGLEIGDMRETVRFAKCFMRNITNTILSEVPHVKLKPISLPVGSCWLGTSFTLPRETAN